MKCKSFQFLFIFVLFFYLFYAHLNLFLKPGFVGITRKIKPENISYKQSTVEGGIEDSKTEAH